jgi:hypothetical protein
MSAVERQLLVKCARACSTAGVLHGLGQVTGTGCTARVRAYSAFSSFKLTLLLGSLWISLMRNCSLQTMAMLG